MANHTKQRSNQMPQELTQMGSYNKNSTEGYYRVQWNFVEPLGTSAYLQQMVQWNTVQGNLISVNYCINYSQPSSTFSPTISIMNAHMLILTIITTCSQLWKVLFLASSVCLFLFVYEISQELLNRFAPNSHRRCVWSLTHTSLKVKVKGKVTRESTGTKTAFLALSATCIWFVW